MAYQIFVHAKQKDDAALVDTLAQLLDHVENEIVEFKAASSHFDLHKLGQYFSAISNEANLRDKRFGWLVFGVDDKTHKMWRISGRPLAGENRQITRLFKFPFSLQLMPCMPNCGT